MTPMTEGGGFIDVIPNAELLAPVTKCECKWGKNDCPNPPVMIVICWDVKGFTVCCDPHVMNFAAHVDPNDGSYHYLTLDQFERAKAKGLYNFNLMTWRAFWLAAFRVIDRYDQAVEYGIFPAEVSRGS